MSDTRDAAVARPVGLLRRFACMLYDGLLAFAALMLTTLAMTVVTNLLAAGLGIPGLALSVEHPLYPVFSLLLLGVAYAYFGWFWTHGGVTLGMQTWHIRLVGHDGRRVTWWLALRRFLVALGQWILVLAGTQAWRLDLWPVAIAAGLIILAGLAWSWFHPHKLMLHDVLSGTRLIRIPEYRKGLF